MSAVEFLRLVAARTLTASVGSPSWAGFPHSSAWPRRFRAGPL